jgi:hypothetical protein
MIDPAALQQRRDSISIPGRSNPVESGRTGRSGSDAFAPTQLRSACPCGPRATIILRFPGRLQGRRAARSRRQITAMAAERRGCVPVRAGLSLRRVEARRQDFQALAHGRRQT